MDRGYYGLPNRVASLPLAISVVGFSAVRSLTAVTASGVRDPGSVTPPGFWEHSSAVAAAAAELAPRAAQSPGDAFAAGLLHDLGGAVLFNLSPSQRDLVRSHGYDSGQLRVAELETHGMTHDAATARLLTGWRFPITMVDAVANHHEASESHAPLVHVLAAADILAGWIAAEADPDLEMLGRHSIVASDEIEEMTVRISERAALIASSLRD